MSQLPTVGAHVALLGTAAFEGSIRQVIYSTNYLTSSLVRAANDQTRAGQAAATAAQRQSALVAKAAEAEAAAVTAAANAQAAGVKAAADRQLADQARLVAGFEQMKALQLAQAAGNFAPKTPERAAAQGQAANAAVASGIAVANAAAFEQQAKASEKAAASAEAMASRTAKAAQTAGAELEAFGNSAAAGANVAATGFSAASGIIIAAILAVVAAVALIAAAVVGAGINAIKMGADYSQAMNTVQTLSGETNSKMSELNDVILNIGTTTTKSMGDAAAAAGELAKGGVSVDDAMKGALRSVVNLSTASAGELDLASAAKAVANGMAAFNLEGAQSVKVADAITGVAQSTTATYSDLAHSLQQVGTVAHALNYSIEDTYTAIGLLSLNAIKGSDAGTALRTMFQHLEHPSQAAAKELNKYGVSLYDATGAARPLRDVVINLEKAFGTQAVAAGKLTQQTRDAALATIFGTDGMRAALSLISQGVEGYDRLAAAQANLTAEDVAGKMLIPLNAQLAILANNINAAAVQFGGAFEPALQQATATVLGFAQGIATNTAALTLYGNTISALATGKGFDALYTQLTNVFGENTGNKVIEFVNLFRNIGDAIGQYIMPAFASLGDAVSNLFSNTGNVDQFSAVMTTLAQGANVVAMVMGFVIQKIADFVNLLAMIPEDAKFPAMAAAMSLMLGPIGAIIAGLLIIPKEIDAILTALVALPPIGATVGAAFSAIGTAIQAALSGAGAVFDAIGTEVRVLDSVVVTVFQGIVSTIGGVFSAIGTQGRAFADAVGSAIQGVLSALSPLVPALLLIAAPFVTLVAVAVLVGQQLGGVFDAIGGALSTLGSTVQAAVAGFADSFNALGDEFKIIPKAADESVEATNKALVEGLSAGVDAATSVVNDLVNNVGDAFSALGTLVATLGEGFGKSFSDMGTLIQPLWTQLWTWVYDFFGKVVKGLLDAGNVLGVSFGALFSAIGTFVQNIWNATWIAVVEVFTNFIKTIVTNIGVFANSIRSSFVSAGNAIGGVWHSMWQGLVTVVTSALNALGEKLNGFFQALKASPIGTFVEGAIGGFQQFGDSAVAAMSAVGEKVDEIQSGIQGQLAALQANIRATSGAFEGLQFSVPDSGAALGGGPGIGRSAGSGGEPSTGAGDYPVKDPAGDRAAKKAAQDAAEALKKLEELYQDTMRKLQNLADDTGEKIAAAWKKHEDAMVVASRENAEKLINISKTLDDALTKENYAYDNKDVRDDLKRNLTDQIEIQRTARARMNEDAQIAHQIQIDDTRRARDEERRILEQSYQYEQEDQERAIARGIESIDRGVARSNAAVQRGLQEQQQMQSRALSNMFAMQDEARQESYSAEDAARSRARTQMHNAQQLAQDLASATDPADRARIQQRAQEQAAQDALQAQEQQQDLAIASARKAQERAAKQAQQGAEDTLKRQQQAQSTALGYAQEDADAKRKQGQEDANVKRQRDNAKATHDYQLQLDADERKTRQGEDTYEKNMARGREDAEKAARKLEDEQVRDQKNEFEKQDHITRINNIIETYNTAVLLNRREYEEKKAAIDKSLADELTAIEANYEKVKRTIVQAWEDAWQELIDKSPTIIGELDTLFGSFMSSVSATDALVQGLIADLRTAIALQATAGAGGNTSNGNQGGSTAAAEDNSTPQSAPAGEPDFAHGGIVPGRWGSRQRIMAHGGEVYMGLNNQMAQYMPTAMQLASVSNQANTQSIVNSSVVTNVTYAVNANYQNQQSPATIAMDLNALGAMMRR